MRAEKFVVYKTGPKPEHKLTPAEGALLVEVTVDGEKEPMTLALGAEAEGGKSYYAHEQQGEGRRVPAAEGAVREVQDEAGGVRGGVGHFRRRMTRTPV